MREERISPGSGNRMVNYGSIDASWVFSGRMILGRGGKGRIRETIQNHLRGA